MLEIKNLHAGVEGREILRGINLTVKAGEGQKLLGVSLEAVSKLVFSGKSGQERLSNHSVHLLQAGFETAS